jgi:hypothetical protein
MPVRTLGTGESMIAASVGGPTIALGSTHIPLPYLSAGYFRGASDNLTLGATVHLIPAALGDAVVDVAGVYCLHKQSDLPEVTATLQLGLLTDFRFLRNVRCFPTIGLNASQALSQRLLGFVGFENTIQFASPSYIVSPYLGVRYTFSEGFRMTLQSKWMAANVNTANGLFEGAGSLGGNGDIGVFVGMEFGL